MLMWTMLWAALIPSLPIMFGGGNVLLAIVSAALALCTFGLWLERDRHGGKATIVRHENRNVADRRLPVAA